MPSKTRVELTPGELRLAMELTTAHSVQVEQTEMAILGSLKGPRGSDHAHSLARKMQAATERTRDHA